MLGRTKLGLVLGGGGARGGAHLGVLRVLNDVGFDPDVIVGTSIGAIVSAFIGAGWTVPRLERLLESMNFDALLRVGRSGRGLLDTEPMACLLTDIFGNADLRDLTPRVAVMAADINNWERVLLQEGSVVQALMASSAVPGLFAAVPWGDRLLVDGGIVSNVPTQAAFQLGAQRVIAVDLGEDMDLGLALSEIGTFSRQLQRALYWLLDLSKRQATFDSFIRATILSYRVATEYELSLFPPDVLLRPDVDHVGLMSMECASDAILAGEQAAREVEEDIRALHLSTYLPQRLRRWRQTTLPPLVSARLPEAS